MQILSKLFYRIEEEPFTRPNLTENGTMGESSSACEASSVGNSYPAYRAFDNDDSTFWQSSPKLGSSREEWITFYNPTPIKLTSVTITHGWSGLYCIKTGYIQGSNDNSSWNDLATINTSSTSTLTVDLNNTEFYKYYRFYATTVSGWNGGDGTWYCWEIKNISMTGTYEDIE